MHLESVFRWQLSTIIEPLELEYLIANSTYFTVNIYQKYKNFLIFSINVGNSPIMACVLFTFCAKLT